MGITFVPLQAWVVVGIMFLIVITLLSKVFKQIERRINRGGNFFKKIIKKKQKSTCNLSKNIIE